MSFGQTSLGLLDNGHVRESALTGIHAERYHRDLELDFMRDGEPDLCLVDRQPIRTMCWLGTGVCSLNCHKKREQSKIARGGYMPEPKSRRHPEPHAPKCHGMDHAGPCLDGYGGPA